MGAEDAEGLAWGMPEALAANERPVAAITIAHSYAIGRTEVTRAQFAEFVEETGFTTMKGCSHLTDWGWQMQPEFTWRDNSIGDSDDHPAPCLRRAEILAYLDWLSVRTGHAYRLPSEAEWEYAARANSKFAAFWGEDWTQACAFQNGADRSFAEVAADIPYDQFADCDDGYAFTAPVASFEPNAFGLYDVAGNVSELTADCLCAGSRGRAPGWNALPRALLPDVGDQGRVLGRFSRVAEGGDTPAHIRDNGGLWLRFSRGARHRLSAGVGHGGSFALESVAGLAWNGWQRSIGISGRLHLERAVG